MINKYTMSMRVYHWITALIVLCLIAAGWIMTELEDSVSYKYEIYKWHKAFGVLIMFLIIFRIINRLKSKLPQDPKGVNPKEFKIAKIVHSIMYLIVFLTPLVGYIMSDAGDYAIWFFGITMPGFLSKNNSLAGFFNETHGFLAYTLLTLIILHVLGTLKHLIIDKKNLLKRII